MICEGCGEATGHVRIRYVGGVKEEQCSFCGDFRRPWCPDVYLEPGSGERTNMNICDPKTRRPVPYSSKREKADILRRLNLKEAGGLVHGSRW